MSRRPRTSIQLGDEPPVRRVSIGRTAYPVNKSSKPEKTFVNQLVMNKIEEKQKDSEEKRKTMALINSYDPWGKPGGGAPAAVDSKRHKLILDDDKHYADTGGQNEFGQALFASGGNKGYRDRVRRETRGDAADMEIFFQPNHRNAAETHVDRRMRFMPQKQEAERYLNDLNQLKQHKEKLREEERQMEKNKETEMLKYNPYGKPGAGAPNRTQSGRPKLGFRSDSLTNKPNLSQPLTARDSFVRSPNQPDEYDPWNKGSGNPIREENGYIRRRSNNAKELLGMKPTKLEPLSVDGNKRRMSSSTNSERSSVLSPAGTANNRRQLQTSGADRDNSSISSSSNASWTTPMTQSRMTSANARSAGAAAKQNRFGQTENGVPIKFKGNDKSIVRNPITGDVNKQNHREIMYNKKIEESRESIDRAKQYYSDLQNQVEQKRKMVSNLVNTI